MINEQKPMAAAYNDTGEILVHSIFKTIQGEGPFCGDRAIFVRLFGCNLRCPGCDTEYTSKREAYTPEALVLAVKEHDWGHGDLVVLTGGEPFRQNVVPAIYAMLTAGFKVQVETNGVLAPPRLTTLDHFLGFSIVCSPKTNLISPIIEQRAIAYKYVLRVGEVADDGLPTIALGHTARPQVARPTRKIPVYVQPMDEQDDALNRANTVASIESVMTHGYRLQIQTHKLLGLA
jgi:7-carboxy-7-deazaguanine synthase